MWIIEQIQFVHHFSIYEIEIKIIILYGIDYFPNI